MESIIRICFNLGMMVRWEGEGKGVCWRRWGMGTSIIVPPIKIKKKKKE